MPYTGNYKTYQVNTVENLRDQEKFDPNANYSWLSREMSKARGNYKNFEPYEGYGTYINSIADDINNYSPYNFSRQGEWDDLVDQIRDYGPYQERYYDQTQDQLNRLLNREKYSYDPNNDQIYQIYKDQYTNAGRNAMKDTLAQMSRRTGGLASSYAGSVAQQQYNKYMEGLANIIPQLEQIAYNRYQDEGNNYRTNIGLLDSLENSNYNRYNGEFNNLVTKNGVYSGLNDTEYGRWRDSLGDLYNRLGMYQNMDETGYGRWRDSKEDAWNVLAMYNDLYDKEFNRWGAENDNRYNLASLYGQMDEDEWNRALEEMALAGYGSGGSGGSGGGSGRSYYSGSGSGSGTTSEPQYQITNNGIFDEKGNLVAKYSDPDVVAAYQASKNEQKKTTKSKAGGGAKTGVKTQQNK